LARKILLADDSVTAQNMGRRILVDAGYEVITVNNGSSALKKVSESRPDLIVLDVYMPGYSGLEVCQRIRESQDTARIPVLLTVGKLEPFKADEVRRVRADAFIVKPFEASELLTALAKLEDKIVPQPSGRKSRKNFADEEPGAGKEFGDVESGWKNRLKIPPPHHPRTHEPAPSANSEPVAAKASEEREAAEQPQSAAEITVEPNPIEAPGVTSANVESAKAEQSASEVDSGVSVEPETAAIASVQASQPLTNEVKEDQKSHEQEVAAALASLAPSNGHGAQASASELVPVTMAAAIAGQEYSGPRWVAEEVPLSDDESSLVLDQEMQKAFAAFAAADAARMSSSSPRSEYRLEAAEAPQAQPLTAPDSDRPADTYASPSATSQGQEQVPSASSEPAAGTPAPEPKVEETEVRAAYAAAASAGASASVAEVRVTSQPEVATEAAAPVESGHDSKLASAWASWKQVRDSVSSPEFTSQIADAAAAGFKEIRQEEPSTTSAPEAAPGAEDSGAIASIVDSVLAELKPKLMEEIAKKMKKDK